MCWSLQGAARHRCVTFLGGRENQHCSPLSNYAEEAISYSRSLEEHHRPIIVKIHVVSQHQPHFQDENHKESATDKLKS